MTPIEGLIINIAQAAQLQVEEFKRELIQQGHVDTKKLYNSIDKKVTLKIGQVIRGEISAEGYGLPLNDGVPASKVRYNPFWLMGWAGRKRPSLSEKELKSFVFAIWQKHKKEGIPTSNSRIYSRNGYRTKWIERAVKNGAKKFNAEIRKGLQKFAIDLLEQTLNEIRQGL